MAVFENTPLGQMGGATARPTMSSGSSPLIANTQLEQDVKGAVTALQMLGREAEKQRYQDEQERTKASRAEYLRFMTATQEAYSQLNKNFIQYDAEGNVVYVASEEEKGEVYKQFKETQSRALAENPNIIDEHKLQAENIWSKHITDELYKLEGIKQQKEIKADIDNIVSMYGISLAEGFSPDTYIKSHSELVGLGVGRAEAQALLLGQASKFYETKAKAANTAAEIGVIRREINSFISSDNTEIRNYATKNQIGTVLFGYLEDKLDRISKQKEAEYKDNIYKQYNTAMIEATAGNLAPLQELLKDKNSMSVLGIGVFMQGNRMVSGDNIARLVAAGNLEGAYDWIDKNVNLTQQDEAISLANTIHSQRTAIQINEAFRNKDIAALENAPLNGEQAKALIQLKIEQGAPLKPSEMKVYAKHYSDTLKTTSNLQEIVSLGMDVTAKGLNKFMSSEDRTEFVVADAISKSFAPEAAQRVYDIYKQGNVDPETKKELAKKMRNMNKAGQVYYNTLEPALIRLPVGMYKEVIKSIKVEKEAGVAIIGNIGTLSVDAVKRVYDLKGGDAITGRADGGIEVIKNNVSFTLPKENAVFFSKNAVLTAEDTGIVDVARKAAGGVVPATAKLLLASTKSEKLDDKLLIAIRASTVATTAKESFKTAFRGVDIEPDVDMAELLSLYASSSTAKKTIIELTDKARRINKAVTTDDLLLIKLQAKAGEQ